MDRNALDKVHSERVGIAELPEEAALFARVHGIDIQFAGSTEDARMSGTWRWQVGGKTHRVRVVLIHRCLCCP